jgi:hypothetical protein
MKAPADRIKEIEAELHELEARRQGLLAEMCEIRSAAESPELPLGKGTPGTNEEKIDLFLSLFGARRSVYPKLWINHKKSSKGYSPACGNEWVHGLCEKPRVKCSDCPNQNFPPLDHLAIHSHLTGRHTIGTYAIREDDSCIFLAADFDGAGWMQDIEAYRRAAEQMGISVAVERSRSGNGGFLCKSRACRPGTQAWNAHCCPRFVISPGHEALDLRSIFPKSGYVPKRWLWKSHSAAAPAGASEIGTHTFSG